MHRHSSSTEVLAQAIVVDTTAVFGRRGSDPDRCQTWSDHQLTDQTAVVEPLA